jgi:hypothetical protein
MSGFFKIQNQKTMNVTNEKVVVLRAGVVTEQSLEEGAEKVDTQDKVYNLSVQVTPSGAKQDDATINELLQAIPNAHYALTFAKPILDKGGVIEYAPLPGNPYHGLISNITYQDLYAIFKINKH